MGEAKPGRRIEDYAVIGDMRTVALVGRDGAIDWLCLPQLDSPACFAALLGTREHGFWRIAPAGEVREVSRQYRGDTLVLETDFITPGGRARLIDFMPIAQAVNAADLVRIVVGLEGEVEIECELALRFDYGRIIPWVRRSADGIVAIAGASAVQLHCPCELQGRDMRTFARFTLRRGQRVPFTLTWHRSYGVAPALHDPEQLLAETTAAWTAWSKPCAFEGPERDAVVRSLITLKALTHGPSGGIAAAATCSLPERIGGERNWDYRFCWLRDATFTLYALLLSGFQDEAAAWVSWLLRAAAGAPSQLGIMYTVRGDRVDGEMTLDWLPGYEHSKPVRIGNAAQSQVQLDVYGEMFDVLHAARKAGLKLPEEAWAIQRALVEHVERIWHLPDHGLWEVRTAPRQFTHSKLMAWVALDRAIDSVERFGLPGPVERWRGVRQQIRDAVLREGFNTERNAFVQEFGGDELDAALLTVPLLGFLPAEDPRVVGTVEAIRRELVEDGLVLRYRSERTDDGLPPGEGTFLICSFWLADCLVLQGRRDEAEALFAKLLALRNDVGLLAEQYDVRGQRQLGNFPQAFSHVGVISTAHNLRRWRGPAEQRRT